MFIQPKWLSKIKENKNISDLRVTVSKISEILSKAKKENAKFSEHIPKKYSLINFVVIAVFSITSVYFAKQNEMLAYGVTSQNFGTIELSDLNTRIPQNDFTIPEASAFADIKIPVRKREKPVVYTVQSGDTVIGIANEFDINASSIIYSNNLSKTDPIIRPGQNLTIPHIDGITYTVQSGDTYEALATKYRSDAGKAREANAEIPFEPGQIIVLPNGQPPEPPKPVYVAPQKTTTPSYNPPIDDNSSISEDYKASGNWYWPIGNSSNISQYFGRTNFNSNHTGIDIAKPSGTPIRAAQSGKVITAGWSGGYGNLTVIDHGNGYTSWYGHQSAFKVSVGDWVEKGQIIGLEGSTGWSTGPHLHFEIRKNGALTNPLNYTYDNK